MKTTKCKGCGGTFEQPKSGHKLYCEICGDSKERNRQNQHKYYQQNKKAVDHNDMVEKQKQSDCSVEKWHREILEYERKYGKRISYGDLQKLKRLGKF